MPSPRDEVLVAIQSEMLRSVARADAIEAMLGSIATTLGKMETRLGAMETALDTMGTTMDGMETTLGTLTHILATSQDGHASQERIFNYNLRTGKPTRFRKTDLRDAADPALKQ